MNPFIFMGIMQGVGGVANFFIGRSNAKEQLRYQERLAKDTADGVYADLNTTFAAVGRRSVAQDRAAARQRAQLVREYRQAAGRTTTQAAAGGVSGDAVDEALQDLERQQNIRSAVIREQREIQRANAQLEMSNAADRGFQQIRQAAGGPVAQPDPLNALFQIGGQLASTWAMAKGPTPQ